MADLAPGSNVSLSEQVWSAPLRALARRRRLRLLRLFDFFFVTVVAFGHIGISVWVYGISVVFAALRATEVC